MTILICTKLFVSYRCFVVEHLLVMDLTTMSDTYFTWHKILLHLVHINGFSSSLYKERI